MGFLAKPACSYFLAKKLLSAPQGPVRARLGPLAGPVLASFLPWPAPGFPRPEQKSRCNGLQSLPSNSAPAVQKELSRPRAVFSASLATWLRFEPRAKALGSKLQPGPEKPQNCPRAGNTILHRRVQFGLARLGPLAGPVLASFLPWPVPGFPRPEQKSRPV